MSGTSTFLNALACPACHGELKTFSGAYRCTECSREYRNDSIQIIFEDTGSTAHNEADTLFFVIKNFFKARAPWFFRIVYEMVAIDVGPKAWRLVDKLPDDAIIINIGSGVRHVHPRVVNIDLAKEQGVDLVASAYRLPLKSESVDLVISESLLEHLDHPEVAVAEMHRVLKKDGRVYILTPFMVGFHSSPNDFYRWTIPGMKVLLQSFSVTDAGVAVGPTCALTWMLREWLAIALSFGVPALYQFWTVIFLILLTPFNIFDFVFARYKNSSQIAMSYYWIAKKK